MILARFRQVDVDEAKGGTSHCDRELEALLERVVALDAQLPTPEQVQDARGQGQALIQLRFEPAGSCTRRHAPMIGSPCKFPVG